MDWPCSRARALGIEEQQRASPGDAGDRQDFLPGHVLVAGKRDRGDAEAGRIGDGVPRILEVSTRAGTWPPRTTP